jgi:3'5'-cyclic nucleotide phosphodiesterase
VIFFASSLVCLFVCFPADEKNDILCNLKTEQRVVVRKMIIDLVLGTDFSKHFALLGQFKSKQAAGGGHFQSLLWLLSCWCVCFSPLVCVALLLSLANFFALRAHMFVCV